MHIAGIPRNALWKRIGRKRSATRIDTASAPPSQGGTRSSTGRKPGGLRCDAAPSARKETLEGASRRAASVDGDESVRGRACTIQFHAEAIRAAAMCCGMSSRRGLSGRRAVETRAPRQGVHVLRLSAPVRRCSRKSPRGGRAESGIALRWKARGSGGLAWKRARLPLLSAYAQSEVRDLRTASIIGATRRVVWAPLAGRDVCGNAQSSAGKRVFGVVRQVPRLLV